MGRDAGVFSDGPASAVHVNGDYLSVVVGFYLSADVSFVNRLAEAVYLFSGAV